jgi:hypothetical protein
MTSNNPHKEEDEGYLAAEAGRGAAENPYPRGTIRFEQWRAGWQIKRNETQSETNDGYVAAEAGQSLSANPHPRGTIRYEQWRVGWQIKQGETERALRLAETHRGSERFRPAPESDARMPLSRNSATRDAGDEN